MKVKTKKKQKEEDDDDANDDDNDDVDDDDGGGGGDGDDDVCRLTVIDVRKKGLLVSFWKTTHIHPIWARGDLESAAPPACQGSCMQKLPPLLLHQKKEKKKARVDWGSNCWRAKRTKKMKSIGYAKRKEKTKKAFFLPRLLLLPLLFPHIHPLQPFFCPVSCILNLPIRHPTALASSSHAN